jgi:hypothetical protein
MSDTATSTWYEANQQYLMAQLAVVREALERHAAHAQDMQGEELQHAAGGQTLQAAMSALSAPAALDTLCTAFMLSPFERHVLVLCAGIELDAAFPSLCATAHGDARRPYPTFSLALAALPGAHWSALTPVAPLRYWRLIEMGPGDGLTTSPLRIDERVLHYLTGVSYLDARLQGLVSPLPVVETLPASYQALAQRITDVWSPTQAPQHCPIIQLCGSEHEGKHAIATTACRALGMQGYSLRAGDIPGSAAEREALSRLWEREAILSNSMLLVDGDDLDHTDNTRPLLAFLGDLHGLLMVSSREPLCRWQRPAIRLDVPRPTPQEQRGLWHSVLGAAAPHLNGQVDAVVSQFHLSMHGMHAASAAVLASLAQRQTEAPGPLLWEACRMQARPRLDDLAQRLEPVATWDDLVLPEAQQQVLVEIKVHVQQRARVYERWGFAAKGSRGLGISALFAGQSGTGKTMAAEVLANDLRLDLYRIDLSQVVSKYIGETEKNLRRVFDAAEEGGAVLLFDEADALFGKRSEVKDSHDRYANIEVSYLLQRMEAYGGLAILTTNMKSALDTAFLRRIRFVVQFPFPDVAQRAEIWRRIFPPDTPTTGLDVGKLARLNVAGGNIRNIALQAAFLAAEGEESVCMWHLLHAARREYAKLEKPLTDAEIGGWV